MCWLDWAYATGKLQWIDNIYDNNHDTYVINK